MSPRFVIALLLAAACPAQADEASPADARAALADCFDPSHVRNWESVTLDEVVVDAGRRKFHLQLRNSCPELAYNHTATFLPGTGVGRICDKLGDRIVLPQGSVVRQRCGIGKVTPIDRAQYQRYLSGNEPRGEVSVRDDKQPDGAVPDA